MGQSKISEFIEKLDSIYESDSSEDRLERAESLLLSAREEAKLEAETTGNSDYLLTVLNETLGFYRETSQFEKLEEICKSTYELVNKMDKVKGTRAEGSCYLNMATAYRAAGKLAPAMKLYGEVFELYGQIIEDTDFAYAELYNNVSLLYQELGKYDMAEKAQLSAMEICKITPNKEYEMAVTHANLGMTRAKLGIDNKSNIKLMEAHTNLREAIKLFKMMGVNDSHHATALTGIGDILTELNDYVGARTYYENAMKLIIKHLGKNEWYKRVAERLDLLSEKEKTKGLGMARDFYENCIKKLIDEKYSNYADKIAVGKVGEGSECFGFDDEISKDHDYEIGLSLWLSEKDYEEIGEALNDDYWKAHDEYNQKIMGDGRKTRSIAPMAMKRYGVRTIEDFYSEVNEAAAYFDMREEALAALTNGEVFYDPAGAFSSVREKLMRGYPEYVRLVKIAELTTIIGQSAQYNFPRAAKRNDIFTMTIEKGKSIAAISRLIYILNDVYAPHDKLLRRGLLRLEVLSEQVENLDKIAALGVTKPEEVNETIGRFEEICVELLKELNNQGLVTPIFITKEPNIAATDTNTAATDTNTAATNANIIENTFLADYMGQFSEKISLYNKSIDELAEMISVMEFAAFDEVKNEGGRASCQDDWETFHIMRKSQYLTWTKEMLIQYITDFNAKLSAGINMITEKYGRMMETTVPWEYEKIKDSFPYVDPKRRALAEKLIAIQVSWMEAFSSEYPGLAKNARLIHTSEDRPWDTSYETYLRGELLTYTDQLLVMYAKFILGIASSGGNLVYDIMKNTVKMYGYESLDSAQEHNE